MLIDYSFQNFRSFKEMVEFSLLATEKEREKFPENYYHNSIDVLKCAVIVGENAGGKSNFVNSLQFLKYLFASNRRATSRMVDVNDSYTSQQNVKYCDTLQKFSLSILVDNVVYNYLLGIDMFGVKSEKLCIGDDKKTIFDIIRRENNVVYDSVLNSDKQQDHIELNYQMKLTSMSKEEVNLLNRMLKNGKEPGLFISKFSLLGLEPAVIVSNWINDVLCVESSPYGAYDIQQNTRILPEDMKILHDKRFIDILRMIDPSIQEISLDERAPYLNTIITRSDKDNNLFKHELMSDSAGVRDFFAWAVQIYKVVYQNKVLFADEMDRSLNPVLSDKIISFIRGSKHQGQFIFTTHNVLHLNLNTYMKEQIYFVTKNQETLQSELYSLSDFEDIGYNEKENIYEFYMKGVLGGTGCG